MRPNSWAQAEMLRVPFAEFNCIKLPGSPVKAIHILLRDMIIGGQAKPSFIDATGFPWTGHLMPVGSSINVQTSIKDDNQALKVRSLNQGI